MEMEERTNVPDFGMGEDRKEAVGDLAAHKVTLERLNRIFAEREREYRLREESLNETQKKLNRGLEGLKRETGRMEEKRQVLEEKEKQLQELETQLQKKKAETDALYRDALQKKEEAEHMREQKLMETAVLKEEMENEKLKYQRLKEACEQRLLLAESVRYPLPEETEEAEMLKAENQELQKENIRLEEALRKLTEEKEELVSDRKKLLKQMFSGKRMQEEATGATPIPEEEEKAEPETSKEPEGKEGETVPADEFHAAMKAPEKLISAVRGEAEEDLTAEVLAAYLERTEADAVVQVRHSEASDQTVMERRGLTYVFVFESANAWFDIRVKKKNSRYLQKLLRKFNDTYHFCKFTYDTETGEVVATGDMDTEQSAYHLMEQINNVVTECFNEE